jgi:putative ABC transport system ATP-binding protein
MIDLKNITKSYDIWLEKFTVLHGIDLYVKQGDYLSIMWPSGSGKSTLMNIIGMLDDADSWEYIIDGVRVDNIKESKKWIIRREKIGFIFQNYSLIPRISVLEQVKLPLIYQWKSDNLATKMALKSLKRVGLEGKESNMPNEISWGQKQRVAIARALVIAPKLMLADEPTWALDSKTSKEIMDLFQELNEEWKTIIVITHEKEIANRTKRTIVVRDWNIVN